MSKNLRKKVVKQQSRLAALNLLGTPVGSEVEDNADSDTGDSLNGDSVIAHRDASTVEDDLRRCVDDLGEKRASSREVALTNLSKILSHHYCGFFFEQNNAAQEALLQLLIRSIRKPGSVQESVLATKAIALTFVNGAGTSTEGELEDFYSLVLHYLKETIKDSSDVELKCQSIETLAMVTFTAASETDTKGGLDYFYKILISNASNIQLNDEGDALSPNDIQTVLEFTLRAYGLLYASEFGEKRASQEDAWDEWQAVMPAHSELLAAKSKDVRVAAGENVALMYECSHSKKKHVLEGEEVVIVESKDEENDMSEYEEMDELIDILTRLAKESSRHVNKQDRKEQKRSFRHILNSIQNGESIKERLKLGRVKFLFHGWTQILELHAFRSILGPGLANHFDQNELVQSVFQNGIEDSSDEEELHYIGGGDSGGDDDNGANELGSMKLNKQANRSKRSKKFKDY